MAHLPISWLHPPANVLRELWEWRKAQSQQRKTVHYPQARVWCQCGNPLCVSLWREKSHELRVQGPRAEQIPFHTTCRKANVSSARIFLQRLIVCTDRLNQVSVSGTRQLAYVFTKIRRSPQEHQWLLGPEPLSTTQLKILATFGIGNFRVIGRNQFNPLPRADRPINKGCEGGRISPQMCFSWTASSISEPVAYVRTPEYDDFRRRSLLLNGGNVFARVVQRVTTVESSGGPQRALVRESKELTGMMSKGCGGCLARRDGWSLNTRPVLRWLWLWWWMVANFPRSVWLVSSFIHSLSENGCVYSGQTCVRFLGGEESSMRSSHGTFFEASVSSNNNFNQTERMAL